ncbi:MAG: methionine--tRNA ligase [Candidatus Margulisiibacteriota bacterium]|jgi:methionyl-tRNA synthetase
MRNILVTSALPYANGSIHLGHLLEEIQTDIWVRLQKFLGHNCVYICADDTHGTAIMLSAKKNHESPEELIKRTQIEHMNDFKGFYIDFDNYYTTHSEENKALAEQIFLAAKEKGLIYQQEIEQFYCETCRIFLPDRLIKGTCPKCKTPEQYGDNCENCSATYNPQDLIDPYCVECKNKPILKKSTHYFFSISKSSDELKKWLAQNPVRQEIKNKLNEWFTEGLKDWDISRDAPYFGFNIPGEPDKYFYVWLDAPIGYIASTMNWCHGDQTLFNKIWLNDDKNNPDPFEIFHFIGKDILYFHTLFWPCMLKAAEFKLPKKIFVHGFLTVNGQKMSKSRGTFITASTYLKLLDPELLRYYYASKLTSSIDDIDLNLEDFVFKVNSELINKFINIASRLGKLIEKNFDLQLSVFEPEGEALLTEAKAAIPGIIKLYEDLEYNKALKEIMLITETANKYINDQAPWEVAKTNKELAQAICTTGINFLKLITGLLKPVLPAVTAKIETFLIIDPINYSTLTKPILNQKINQYSHLLERVELAKVKELVE